MQYSNRPESHSSGGIIKLYQRRLNVFYIQCGEYIYCSIFSYKQERHCVGHDEFCQMFVNVEVTAEGIDDELIDVLPLIDRCPDTDQSLFLPRQISIDFQSFPTMSALGCEY